MKKFLILRYIFVITFFVTLFYIFYLNYFDINKNIDKIIKYINNNDIDKIEANINKLKRIIYLPDGNTLLTFAIKSSNIELIKLLIDNGFNLNYPDKNGVTPIEYAWNLGNSEIINLLIKNGVFISDILLLIENNAEDNKTNEFLKLDNFFDPEILSKNLINEYDSIYKQNELFIKKNESLFVLFRNYGEKILNTQLFEKLNSDDLNRLKEINLRLYLISKYLYRYLKIVKYMQNKDWYNIKSILDKEKYSKYILSYLLRVAMNLDLINSFEYLLFLGADPSLIGFGPSGIDTLNGFVHPFFIAINKGNLFYFKKIYSYINIENIKFPIFLEETNEINYLNPINLCIENNFNEGIFHIINTDKSKVDYLNNKGESLIVCSILKENYNLFYFLLKSGANINIKVNYDNYNRDLVPLHFAIIKNNFSFVKALIEEYRKRDINFPDIKAICMYNGNTFTSLSLSSYLNFSEIFKYLLYINIDNCLGLFDSLQYAFKNENYNLIRTIYLSGYFNKLKYEEQEYFFSLAKKINKDYLFSLPKEEEY